jgi:hypothetical protein
MKVQFYRFPDESVHIPRLAGKDLHLLKSGLVIIVDTMFGHCQFIWLRVMVVPSMVFYFRLNSTA